MSALSCREVRVALGGREVLRGVDLALQPGWTAIVGPNGAGKSTLLRVLAGLLAPDAGEVHLDGRELHQWPLDARARHLAWLAQQMDTSGELRVQDVVMLGRLPHLGLMGTPGAADHVAVAQAMAQTECSGWAARRLSALSGGERQRVLLARALAVQAPVLLLDEPTTHLDPPHQVALVRLMMRLGRSDPPRAVVSVLHDLPLALSADHLVVLAAGQVQAAGQPDDPAVQAALIRVFGGALRIERVGGRWVALPKLDRDEPATAGTLA